MKSKISNIFQLEDKKKVKKYKDTYLLDRKLNHLSQNKPKEIQIEFELTERKSKLKEEIKDETPTVNNPSAKSTSQITLTPNKNSFRPRKGDRTPISYTSQMCEAEEEPKTEELIIINGNTPIKNSANKSKNEEDKEKLNMNTLPQAITLNNKEKLKIIDSYIYNYFGSREREKDKNLINFNSANRIKTTNKSLDKNKNDSLGMRSSSCTNFKVDNNNTTKIKTSPKMMKKIEISPVREKEIKDKISELSSNNKELNQRLNSAKVERKLSKSSSNNNMKYENSQTIKDRERDQQGINIQDLQGKFKDISEEFKLFNKNKNQSSINFKHEKKNTTNININKTNDVKLQGYNKFNTQDIIYELVKHYSNTKISKEEDFMKRMMFDVFKRQTKEERFNKIVEKSKPKIDERQRVETFNRLIQDANRRFDDAEKIDMIKKILNEPEPNKKSPEAYEQFAKNYKPPKNWDETYKRLLNFQKEKEETIEKRAIDKEKSKKEDEDKIIQDMNRKIKKASKRAIEKSVDRLYSLAEIRDIKRQDKLRELEKMNDKYLEELCSLKLETKQKENNNNKYIKSRNLSSNKINNPFDTGEKKKAVLNLKRSFVDNNRNSNYLTKNSLVGYNFEIYNRFIYNKSDKNEKISNHKIKDGKNIFHLENMGNKKESNKIVNKNNFKFEFYSDSNDEIKKDFNSNHINENEKIINTRYNLNDVNESLNNMDNNKEKSTGKKFSSKIQDFLDSDDEEERKQPPLPIESPSISFINYPVRSQNIKLDKQIKNFNITSFRGTHVPEHFTNKMINKLLKDKLI